MEKSVEIEILKALQQINIKLDEHGLIIQEQGKMLQSHGELLRLQGETLKEHTGLLNALSYGQESLKAEISELRLQTAKDLGEIKEQLNGLEDSVGVLKEDNWRNKKDIQRLKTTMGMS